MVGSACVLGFVLSSLEAQTSTHIASEREEIERRERGERDAERERGTAESREQSVSDKPMLSAPTETTTTSTTRRDVVAVMEKQTTSTPSSYGAVKIYFP